MSDHELCFLTASQLNRLYLRHETSPVEVTRAVLQRIEAIEPKTNAYITVLADAAMAEAAHAEREILDGQLRGPLHGVPISLKDLYYTKGVRTTGGSKVLADFVPTEDATIVARLREAGAITLGKTNMHEFAYGVTTENVHWGFTRNPWDLERVPGGSSGGSGAAVAAGMGVASVGSDTGGSIRIPASACGVVGLKPTYGRVSRYGVMTLSWSLDHVGPLTRSVEDAAAMLTAIAGPDPLDRSTSDLPVVDYRRTLGKEIKNLRIGVPREHFYEIVDPEVLDAVQTGLQVLEGLGAHVEDVYFGSARYSQFVVPFIIQSEAAAYHEPWLQSRAADYDPEVRDRLEMGATMLASDYLRAQRARTAFQSELHRAFDKVDVLVTPTLPIPPFRCGERRVDVSGKSMDARASFTRFTNPFNATGVPAITVPCGFTQSGLPIGLQIVGKPFAEETILSAAHAYEQSTPWHNRRPPL